MDSLKSLKIFNISAFFKSQVLLLPVLYLFYLSNGLSWEDYFLFQGIVVLINVLLQFPVGVLGNYVQRRWILTCSYVLFLGRIFLWIFFHGYWIVLIGEILGAISKSMFDAVESPYIYDVLRANSQENLMTKCYGKLNFAISLGTAIASILGTFLYNVFGLVVLLGTEFLIMSSAVVLSLKLPSSDATSNYKFSLLKVKAAIRYISKSKQLLYPILLSGLFVSFSHFFFWSFQPLMKMASVAIALFGVVIFINNLIRAGASVNAYKLVNKISIHKLSWLTFTFDVIGLLTILYLYKFNLVNSSVCLLYILFLCICIAFQLMFTIGVTSYLQDKVPNRLRGYIASSNMLFARLFTAIILIMPKYLSQNFSLITIFNIYCYVLLILGCILLIKFHRVFGVKIRTALVAMFVCFSLGFAMFNNHIMTSENDLLCLKKIFHKSDNVSVNIQYYNGVGDVWLADDLMISLNKHGFTSVKNSYNDNNRIKIKCPCSDVNLNLMGMILKNENLIDKNKVNILWLIYPKADEDIESYIYGLQETCKLYDAVIVSSKKIYYALLGRIDKPLYYVPQFTNHKKFYYDYDPNVKSDILFVGTYYYARKAPLYALKHNMPITIYGGKWPNGVAKDKYIDNRILRKYYSSAKIVLNDTAKAMRELDFVSNRIFDATASGAFVISDYSPGIVEIYGDSVPTWKTEDEFVKLVNYYLSHPEERMKKAKKAQQITLSQLTDDKIVPEIKKIIDKLK